MTVLSNLPAHLTTVLLGIVGLLILLQMTETITVSLNSLYIQVTKKEYCLYKGEAFDRVTGNNFMELPTHSWNTLDLVSGSTKLSASNYSTLEGYTSGTLVNNLMPCQTTAAAAATGVYKYTPGGKEIKNNAKSFLAPTVQVSPGRFTKNQTSGWVRVLDPYSPKATALGTNLDSNRHFLHPSENEAVKFLLAQLLGLGIPVGLMMTVGTIGRMFVYQGDGESSGIDSTIGHLVILVVMIMVVVSVFGLLTGSIQDAFNTIDPNRFSLYDNPLGRIASTVIGFWSVLFIAGLLPIAFSLFISKAKEKMSGK